jgi:transcriptional regulator with XRE-family HTH domain
MARSTVGPLLRAWRTRRNRSQLDLALDVGVSARHLSFVENGRARPSPELVLALAERLDVPLRERNTLLLAAGHAPRYAERTMDDPSMARVRSSLERLLDAQDPYPGVVIDQRWNVRVANRAAQALLADLPPTLREPTVNVFRACLHPDGLAPRTVNFDEWSAYLLGQLRRSVHLTGDRGLADIEEEVRAYPDVVEPRRRTLVADDDPPLLVPFVLRVGAHELAFFTTLTTFGTPRDITLEELCVELFFPADDATERVLRSATTAP